MAGALADAAAAAPGLPLGAYANAFPAIPDDHEANDTLFAIRTDLDPDGYCAFASSWVTAGATMIGGCCGVGPEQIAALSARLR
jgi:S-methylmethionine-dependent homocysteine/selenocysteine methylase